MKKHTLETVVKCNAFGRIGTHRVRVEEDGSVLVWDEVAGHFTRCHRLSRRAERRIAAKVEL